ncbi:TrlF family AAA-like ATPase [Vreelandella salicampi]|uniref:DNA repair protein n=1 Tax=Vreelandella salicampi TaxID=1449798 RepID=A0A7Z0LIE1_9GAMM|nr:hypothetical protein [Halomonas salicampi]NYS59579.1 hypothetical protein [Halomonas salicampi]
MAFYPRGSEWRKWDLHVHTPLSVLNNGFGSDWDSYVKTLFKKAIENDISVIGITDYYLPEGYKILKREYLDNIGKLQALFDEDEIRKIKEIRVFPNIEFRIEKLIISKEKGLTWNRKVNYHILLSDEVSIEKMESDFISQIKFNFNAASGATVEKRPLTKSNLEELGRRLIEEHPPFSKSGNALYVGMLNASVDEDDLISILNDNSNFRGNYLVGLPCDEDLSEVNWNSQGHSIRKNLIKQAHFIFSSNHNTRKFLLGGADKEAHEKEFGPIKPCVWGSDAHNNENLFKPDENRITWIKADATFEGLKSVLYEPSSRVAIQELSPQQKSGYQVISRVRYLDEQKRGLFSESWQPINPDLNTIIGGKSSGKSLLLYHIAKAINKEEVDQKINLSKASSYSDLSGIDFEVEWGNGEISKLSEKDDAKPITYIPQLYINHLAEEDGKGQLNNLVKDILNQSQNFKTFSINQERKIAEINKELTSRIDKLFELRENYARLTKDSEAYGTKAAVSGEVKNLKDKIESLRKRSGFTLEEETAYKMLTSRKKSLENRLAVLEKLDFCSSQVTKSSKSNHINLISDFCEKIISDVDMPNNSTYLKSLLMFLEDELKSSIDKFDFHVKKRSKGIPVEIEKIKNKMLSIEEDLKPIVRKFTDKEALNTSSDQLKKEEHKLKNIDDIEKKKIAIRESGIECKEEIKKLYRMLINCYKEYAEEILKPEYQPEEDLKISAEISFNEERFGEFVSSFDRRGNMQALLGSLIDTSGYYCFDIDVHSENIFIVQENIERNRDIPTLRKGVTDIDLIKRLYSDCFYISFVVHYKGDDIVKMSPGKRGLVLLNLIIYLSNSEHPILIDQPEDNLDNRTIYDQLNEFIKLRKKKRQIIMVTHNANLVVAADSECVIVANQAGQQANIENEFFKFEYCSGSLECSFEDQNESRALKKKGIRQHVCEILEGGVTAFKERELKYGFKK